MPRSHSARTIRSIATIVGLLAAGAIASAQQTNPLQGPQVTPLVTRDARTIYLATGSLQTRDLVPNQTLAQAAADSLPSRRHVIHLDGPITPQRRVQLEAAGVTIGDYLPSNSYIVSLAGADGQALGQIDFVQWHGAFQNAWKLSPAIGDRQLVTPIRKDIDGAGRLALIVTLFEGEEKNAVVDSIFANIPNAAVYYAQDIGPQAEVSLSINAEDLEKLAQIDAVQFVEDAPELTFRNGTTRWIAQSNVSNVTPVYDAGIHGENQIVAVVDGRPDEGHCSLDGGKFLFYNSAAGADFHGTHVAGTVAGDDVSNTNGRGIAYEAKLVFDDVPSFNDAAMYAVLQQHHNQGARVHTNSWGDDGTTAYNSLCRGVDRFSHDFEESLVLFAVTNTSTLKNPDNSKNLLAVGASQDAPSQGSHCSGGIGPTSDGRRKPEIYLPGCSTQSARENTACGYIGRTGTSMASPAVAGSCALIRQYYTDGFYPTGSASAPNAFTPSGALIKATALNSTVDMTGITGYPSTLEGWGRALLDDALHFTGDTQTLLISDVRNAAGLSTTNTADLPFEVESAAVRLKATLVWTDPPASASTGSGPAEINDLNLEIIEPGGATIYKGNVFSGGVSVTGGAFDVQNNVEMVLINAPTVGVWTARVTGAAVNDGPQGYALVITGDIAQGDIPLSLTVTAPNPVPTLVDTGVAVPVSVQIDEGDDTLVPGSVTLHYSADGVVFTPQMLTAAGGGAYTGDIPGFDLCSDTPAFYFSAEGTSTGVVNAPSAGAASPFTYALGTESTSFTDNMETDNGWTVSGVVVNGAWDRGVPVNGSRGDPAADSDGSGQCWLTQNDLGPLNDGNSDIDDGTTILTSGVIDATGGGTLSYDYWFNDIPNGLLDSDAFIVEIATNAAGDNWSTQRTYTTALSLWRSDAFSVPDTATLRIRVSASDLDPQNVVEAGFDNVKISSTNCEDVPPPNNCIGDITGDGFTDAFDFGIFAPNFGTSGHAPFTNGDLDGDGDVDAFDFAIFAPDFGCVPS